MQKQKQKNYQLALIAILAFAVLFMSVGFAAYAQRLTINGTTTVAGNKWSVHFDKSTFEVSDDSVEETSKTIGDTSIEYSVRLAEPGDKFAFSVDVINDGSFDAILDKISMSSLSAAQQKYLRYSVAYGDTELDATTYTATTSNINEALPYSSGSNKKTVFVKVEYILPENASDLPADDVDLNLITHLDYSQAE